MTALPPGVRGIVTGLSIEYLKKARGTITGRSAPTIPTVSSTIDTIVTADMTDSSGDVVARTHVTWRLSPPA